MSDDIKNKDSISSNLEFKTFIFVTLLGGWFWLLNYYISIIPVNSKGFISFGLIITSYTLFYPMIRMGAMLVYSSIYQIENREETLEELKNEYAKHAKAFFGWWPVAIFIAPPFIFIGLISEKVGWAITSAIIILYIYFIKKYLFNKIYTFDDIINHYKIFKNSFFVYLVIFIIIIAVIYFLR
jgi:hypothetical protein